MDGINQIGMTAAQLSRMGLSRPSWHKRSTRVCCTHTRDRTSVLRCSRIAGGGEAVWTFADDKFREMILYIAGLSQDDLKFGKVKLHKLLYYSDFEAYRKLGASISGVEYVNNTNGPMAKNLDRTIQGLEYNRSLDVEEVPRAQSLRPAQVLRPRRPAEMSMFSEAEVAIMDEVVRKYRRYNGTQISDLVHEEPGWRLTEYGETIPYQTAWLAPTKVTPAKLQFARELAEKNGVLG